jgi:lipoprotein-releasing system ATP-binding protein
VSILQAIGISKSWGEIRILQEVNLNVSPGESIAIVGKSGSGKSTFLHICGLLDMQDSGQLIIDGQDMILASDYIKTITRRKKIGFVYQFHHLLSEFNVIENLIIPQLIYGKDSYSAKDNAMILLDRFDLLNKKDSPIQDLSGGQKQRIAIIRAIINNPQLIIADEPTGNLDNDNAMLVFKLLQEVIANSGAGMIIATHSLELANFCSKVILLDHCQFKCN